MSQNRSKSLGTLGLAMKSGNVASGEFLTEQAIRAGTARLVTVAEDASDITKMKFRISCSYYQGPLASQFVKDTLGNAIGKEFRASLAVLDQGFALAISKNLELEEM